ncbi:uncharacterized protein MG328-like [Diabrotica virgifera virgifera]|uniref:Kinetochore protein Nuf2 N-terminal domain-containing protein n=1 Tax=Diabrotica virgifera virgifera TaxID=50390 RepID=A0ABM5JLT1_DIAVI|nr:uncharacterized protein MG328-like [Diabrotica virgifera virgifera]
MDSLLETIKNTFPDFQITKDDILRPSSESVCRIYSTFLSDFEEKIAYAIGFYQDDVETDLDVEEDRIFLKMQKLNPIFSESGMQFGYGDVIMPTGTRTRLFVYVFIHMLNFFLNALDPFEKTCSDVLKIREDIDRLFSEKDNYLIKINDNIIERLELVKANEDLENEIQKLETTVKNDSSERRKKEREINVPLRKDLKRLEMTVEEKTTSIEKLAAKEKKYVEEVITEAEYLELKKLENDLESEKESLKTEDVDMDDFLAYEYKIVDHFRHCGKSIPDPLNVDFINRHIKMEEELEDLKDIIQKLSSDINLNKSTLNHQKQLHEQAQSVCLKTNTKNNVILQNIQSECEVLKHKVQIVKENVCSRYRDALAYNSEMKNKITQLENEFEDLKDHFRKEYIKITKAEDLAIQTFKEHIENLYN